MSSLDELLAPYAQSLIASRGADFVRQIGEVATKEVIFNILIGRNLRDSTEIITRRRLALLNGALVAMFLNGEARWPGFVAQLPAFAMEQLAKGHLSRIERSLAQWILGLTDKGVQNILRDESSEIKRYQEDFVRACLDAVESLRQAHGDLHGYMQLSNHSRVQLTWQIMIFLMSAIGAQTLTIRGSGKSTFGKLFEKLVLGSLLTVLGFRHVTRENGSIADGVFWLSDRESGRESDATLLYESGKGVRFDIGFIGRGNPEITLDKVSRFERQIELATQHWYMSTIIIVDRIGEGSRLRERAKELDGIVIQMSGSYWPQDVARHLHSRLGFEHPLINMPVAEVEDFLRSGLNLVDIDTLMAGPLPSHFK